MSICGPNCQWPVCLCPKPGARYATAPMQLEDIHGPLTGAASQQSDLCAAHSLAHPCEACSAELPWREFVEHWIHPGHLQTFESRERFRKAAAILLGTDGAATAGGVYAPEFDTAKAIEDLCLPIRLQGTDGVRATCGWQEQDPDGYMPGTYESACGEMWSFTEGGVKENGVRFCHGCGKPVEVTPFPPSGEDGADGVKEDGNAPRA